MLGALFLGLFCGIVARMFVPGDMFRDMSGPVSWLISLVLGLVGALFGYLIFTVGRRAYIHCHGGRPQVMT
jgi:uncharacterized membrane protein YeaQ/YmgE (transglycosylase-associated protein family)